MIKIENLSKSFGDLKVLKGIDLEVERGQVIAIIGPSGTGKSTLLRCINFLEIPNAGQISIDDFSVDVESLSQKQIYEIRNKTSMVFQHYNLFKNKTALENIMEHLVVVKKMEKTMSKEKAIEILKLVGLEDKKDVYPSKLSGGQQQRIGIARAMAVEPKVMLFDEPTSSLDPELVGEVLDVIKKLAERKITMIIVTHEMEFAKGVADRVVFMDNGKIIEQNSPSELFYNPKNDRTIKFLSKITNK